MHPIEDRYMAKDIEVSCHGIVSAYPAQSDILVLKLSDACIEGERKVSDLAGFLAWVEEAVDDINGGKGPLESAAFASLSREVDEWKGARSRTSKVYGETVKAVASYSALSMGETDYLLRSHANAERLRRAIADLDAKGAK